jgi:hypothetical protein
MDLAAEIKARGTMLSGFLITIAWRDLFAYGIDGQ